MASQSANLQHNAAFALYGLADNEDNIASIVREGGVQTLQACEQLVQVKELAVSCQPSLTLLSASILTYILAHYVSSIDGFLMARSNNICMRLEQVTRTIPGTPSALVSLI